ncbi:DUF4167 domain-containing protein [Ketogulonicigenium vulgare]|uniref:Nucleoside triphosphate pyrophosphohydrolase n=1 Tax=Ketogulonicigenium vulgare (strain WSH-001) TaxID=759362 RepID=F9Y6X5_KETVW|nr:DUF4167 domain-containing protein [Ketogulonicigenium vulgare]ADO42807.1 conserved hypothetical protein [Ketogulonicigenium vulgare Y25]AEM40992.1 Nucleoside triphosphate pyrophosphohydrolase [Ketogulonicigenium vulgare WSH-001]ALJ81143.1 NTP pyrophosphohydrolase [Ketogulonicigenium vulgare]ANW33891.1 NTP pyrophosphohydrolase [Ketogulonicigenium vulgare]AOZ54719.1 hypothetical protein KVC_1706 [Ketogulonicigenium vulgare]
MRSSKSRSRGNKNRNNRPFGGNIINRVFDSSGPDGKVRGTPQQIIEKYNQLHRDAQLSGDRVNAENFAQHAEHYTRMLAEAQREVDRAREEAEQANRDRQAERDRERASRQRQGGDAPQEAGEPAEFAIVDLGDDEIAMTNANEAQPEAEPYVAPVTQEPVAAVSEEAAEPAAPRRRPRPPRNNDGEAKPRAPRRPRKAEDAPASETAE